MTLTTTRRARESDSRDLFLWRNDPATRSASLNTSEIAWEDHVAWYSEALCKPTIAFYISQSPTVESESIGMCRFNISEDQTSAEVSINLNPEYRGKGFAQGVLHDSIQHFLEDYANVGELTATIRTSNSASIKIFHSENFEIQNEEDGVYYLARSLRS